MENTKEWIRAGKNADAGAALGTRGSAARPVEHGVDRLFVDRWSPRAYCPLALTREELEPLFEAARWAPSSYNNQPWRILYALRDTKWWTVFLDLLVDENRKWAQHAGALLLFASKTTFDRNGKPSKTHSFDAGAAWQNLALQAWTSGLVAHGMEGFDYEAARNRLKIPDGFEVEAMAAVGKPGSKEDLPEDLRKREYPNDRKDLGRIVSEGEWGFGTEAR